MSIGELLLGLLGVRFQDDLGAVVADVPFGQVVFAHSRSCLRTHTDRGVVYYIGNDPHPADEFFRIGLIDVLVRRTS